MNRFKDHFSKQSGDYRRFRPDYPGNLFAFLAAQSPDRDHAWDCGTGNGQAAVALAKHFKRVTATDPSASQIEQAMPHERVQYGVAPAETSPLADRSVALVTVAQALHWFDFDAFYGEVRRVLKPSGLLAAWGYEWFDTDPRVKAAIGRFYNQVIGPFWPPERELVIGRYKAIPFPFEPVSHPEFFMEKQWSSEDLIGYLSSWSAVQRYRQHHNRDPIPAIADEIETVWPDAENCTFRWRLFLKLGRV